MTISNQVKIIIIDKCGRGSARRASIIRDRLWAFDWTRIGAETDLISVPLSYYKRPTGVARMA
nr:MAG TPA: hypothetical protein [Caudoviricetes sp.]